MLDGNWLKYESGKYSAGFLRTLELPFGATNARLTVRNSVFIGVWRDVFSTELKSTEDVCFNIWGSTFHPSWARC